ncbi:MAG: alpha/beta hydrolase [Mobilitalea sp.]
MECRLENITINYEVEGRGKPIIIIHGSHVDHRIMTGCMEPIFENMEGYKRIYLDLPGMGKTKGESWITSVDDMLKTVIDFIDAVIPNENFLLAGESYGGYLARGIIYIMADRVDGLFLLCPAVVMEDNKRSVPTHIILKKDDELLSQLDPSDAEGFSAMSVVQTETIWKRYLKEVISGVKLADNDFIEHLKEEREGAFSFPVDELTEVYSKPTLVLLGRQDWCVGYKDAWNILDNYPRATFAVLDRAGHNLQIEQEVLFNYLVTEWIARVSESLLDS